MKKYIIIIVSIISSYSLSAQYSQNQAIDIAGGYEINGYFGALNYNKIIGKGVVRIGTQFNFETFNEGLPENVKVNLILLNVEYYYRIFDINQSDIIISLGIGGSAGYESVLTDGRLSNGIKVVESNNAIYGGHAGFEIDKYLFKTGLSGNSISIFIQAREYYFLNSSLGKTQFNAGLGLRYNF